MGSSRGVGVALAVVACVVSGCASESPEAQDREASTPTTDTATDAQVQDRWVSSGLDVHSELSATADSIVYAGVEDEQLQIVALDPASGAERWRRASDVSARIRGVGLEIYTDDDTAYFLTREPSDGSSMAVRSASAGGNSGSGGLSLTAVITASGETRWSTPLAGEANPNATGCGPSVCLVVEAVAGEEVWRFDPETGDVQGTAEVSLPGGPGHDAFLSGIDDEDISTFITASRGPVIIGQHSASGATLDWARPVDEVFGGEDVSPNGGWAGWPTDDGGWVIWLGSGKRPPGQPQAGDTFERGAVGGVTADGSPRWVRPDRHPCVFALAEVPVVCDGILTMTSNSTGSARPDMMEGIDPLTGATTWQLELGGAVDEFDSSADVLRIDDVTLLITTAAGLQLVDLRSGATPGADADAVGWCQPDLNQDDAIAVRGDTEDYLRSAGFYPCRLGGESVDEPASLPVPDFAGVRSGEYSAWVVDGAVHAQRQP